MELIEEKNYSKVLYLENMISRYSDNIKKIKSVEDFSLNPKLTTDLLNFNLNIISYTISLTYFYSKVSSKILSDIRGELLNLVSDFSLVISPSIVITPKELIDTPIVLDANPYERFIIINKFGYLIDFIREFAKSDDKTRISLDEAYLKFIAFSKNIIDFKHLSKNLTPDSPYYKYQAKHFNKVLDLLEEGAFLLRTKYELREYSEYANQSLQYIEAGKVLSSLFSKKEESEKFTKMYDVWSSKFNADFNKSKRR